MAISARTTASAPRAMGALPGPRGWPLLGNALQIRREQFHQQLESWREQYGEPFRFRIGPRHFIAVSDPEVVGAVLRNRPDGFRRSARLETLSRQFGFLGLFSANGDTWRRQRPMVLHGLDPTHIRTFFPVLVDVTQRLRRRWEAAADAGRTINLQADLMRYTVDVTTGLAFGESLDTLGQPDEQAIQQHLNVVLPALFRRILAPADLPAWLHPRQEARLQGHLRALGEAVQGFIARTRRELAAKPALREHPENLIQALVAARDSAGATLTDEDVSGNVLTMLLAGEDTTANTLAWMIWLLFRHPAALQAVRDEVDGVVGPGGVPASVDQLTRFDVIEACANETLRLKPVAPLIINEALQDTVVAGVAVPRGAFVMCLMRPGGVEAAHFAQPQRFDPGRWLRGEGAAAHTLHSAKRVTMPFGAGPRVCPGRYLALTEIRMVAAMLASGFDLREVGTADGGDPAERITLTMAPVGLRMRLARRIPPRTAG